MMADVEIPARALSRLGAGTHRSRGGERRPDVRQSRCVASAGEGRLSCKLLGVATPNAHGVAAGRADDRGDTCPDSHSAAWFAIVAPPKTPQAVVDKINADVNEALRQGDIVARLRELSAEPIGGSPQATAAYMRDEVERWHKVIRTAGQCEAPTDRRVTGKGTP